MNQNQETGVRRQAHEFPRVGIFPHVKRYIESLPSMQGKVALDVPCGDGRATAALRAKGAEVLSLDLFPDSFVLDDAASFADLSEKLPVADACVDLVVCLEGIEHLPNQLFALQEFHRVLRPGGQLIMTTPNISNLVGRLANFAFESQLLRGTPYAAEEASWRMESAGAPDGGKQVRNYYGHIFLVGIQRLRTLHRVAGFTDIRQMHSHKSTSSLLLAPLLLPVIAVLNLKSACHAWSKLRQAPEAWAEKRAQLRANLCAETLFNRNLFLVSTKAA